MKIKLFLISLAMFFTSFNIYAPDSRCHLVWRANPSEDNQLRTPAPAMQTQLEQKRIRRLKHLDRKHYRREKEEQLEACCDECSQCLLGAIMTAVAGGVIHTILSCSANRNNE